MSQIPNGKNVILGLKHCQQILNILLDEKERGHETGEFNKFHVWQIVDAQNALKRAIARYENEASRVRKCQHKKAKKK